MKKSTLFLSLILSVSSVFSAFAQNEYKIDPTKEITTAPDALEGVVAIPTDVDGTSVWTLKGGNDWDLGTLPLAQWGSKAQHNFVKFQKPTGDYSACGVEGNIYTLICINENGENFSQWGNPGAINMQPAGTIMFSLGFGDKGTFGQDGDYLGLWKVDYEEGKGYVLQNVGRILLGTASYASPISANPIEEKTYVKLYSELAINEAITDSKIDAVLNKLNAVPANVTLNLTEVNAAKETVLANRTQENLDALANAVDAAIASANRTSLITNAEINGADGWTTEREFGGNGPLLNGTSFEYWAGNASDRQAASFNYFQTIEIPNGKYVVSVEMYNSSNGEEGDDHAPNGNAGLYATSGEETSFVGVTTDGASFGTVYNTEVVSVKDGKLTLGVKSIGYLSARWFAADNFNLWYVGELDPEPAFADGAYFVKNNTIEGKNLSVTATNVVVAEDAKVFFTNVEGGYVISNEEGQYIHKTGDTWSFDVTTDKDAAYVVSVEPVEGGYELKGAYGTLGLDYAVKAPDNTDLTVYADKTIAFNGVWTIEAATTVDPTPDPDPEPDPVTLEVANLDNGDYFLYNVEAKAWLGGANSWGTQASVVEHPQRFTLTANEDGTYTLDSHTYEKADKHFLGDNLYVDSPVANWTINIVKDGFVLSVEKDKYLATAENTSVLETIADTTNRAVWKIISEAEMLKALEDGAATDATFELKGAAFSRNLYRPGYEDAWTGDAFTLGGANNNQNAQKWGGDSQTFDTYQTISIPNGKYTLTFNGFYRYNNTEDNTNDVAAAAHADGSEVIYSFVYANGVEVALKSIADETAVEAYEKMPFSQNDASEAFEKGLYVGEINFEVTEGTATIGIKKTEHIGTDWTVWDNFVLTRTGDLDPEPQPVNTHENDLRLPLTGGSGEGTELAIEVLESNEDGQPLSAKYTITNGTWGNNASHLSIFKYNLTPDMIKGYKSVIVEFAEALPVSEGNPEYNFIPCGFVCPEGWVDLDGKDVFELEFTDKQKTEGIADFSIFFNANGDVKNATFTIKGLWLVKDATEQPDAIDTVEASENATSVKKMLVNGKLVIVKGDKTYNVAGALLK